MNSNLSHRPAARKAPPELLVLAKWEDFSAWLFEHTGRWPRSARFTLSQRVQTLALEVCEQLVVARYEPRERAATLQRANLSLERMRVLLRLALNARVMPKRGFETAVRGIDETGRMIHGWRQNLTSRGRT